jgi:hypothetical protein
MAEVTSKRAVLRSWTALFFINSFNSYRTFSFFVHLIYRKEMINMDTEKQPVELARLIEKLTGTWNVEISIKLADGTVLNGNGEMLMLYVS